MARTSEHNSVTIFVVSGGTGRTAREVLLAGMAQFADADIALVQKPSIRSTANARRVVEQAHREGAVVCHTLVDPKVRNEVGKRAGQLEVPCIDILGPVLAMLADHLAVTPRGKAGLLYQTHREQFDRLDAMDYTLSHDDGHRAAGWKDADVVLVGASRVSKSVTCYCLAARGVRAANVPLIPNAPVPKELARIDASRVIGLTMNASHLAAIRAARMTRLSHRAVPAYASVRDIAGELRAIREVMLQHGWRCFDVSYMATEEVVSQVLDLMPPRRRRKKVANRPSNRE